LVLLVAVILRGGGVGSDFVPDGTALAEVDGPSVVGWLLEGIGGAVIVGTPNERSLPRGESVSELAVLLASDEERDEGEDAIDSLETAGEEVEGLMLLLLLSVSFNCTCGEMRGRDDG
jgi:hypothetical protein